MRQNTPGIGSIATTAWTVRIQGAVDGDVVTTIAMDETLIEILRRVAPGRVGCRGGGCGVCAVRVVDGKVEKGKMSRRHMTNAKERDGFTLACRTFARSDLTIALEPLATGAAR